MYLWSGDDVIRKKYYKSPHCLSIFSMVLFPDISLIVIYIYDLFDFCDEVY